MQDPLLDLPPNPDIRSLLIVILLVGSALFVGWAVPSLVWPIAALLTECGVLPRLQSGLFAATGVGSVIAVATATYALIFRVRLNAGWEIIPARYAILRQLYIGSASLLLMSGLYFWHDGYRISFGDGCDAGFENPWAFALKFIFASGSWLALATIRVMLQRVYAAHSDPLIVR